MYVSLDNKQIGQSIAKLRNHREIKAAELAKFLNLSTAAYTKYERGETAITINFLNHVAEFFDINPLQLLQSTPENIVENIYNSKVVIDNGSLSTNDVELLNNWSSQIAVKDKQIEQLLQLLHKSKE